MNYSDLDFVIIGPGHAGTTWLGTQLRKIDDLYVTYECNWLNWTRFKPQASLADFFAGASDRRVLGEHGNTYINFPGMPDILHEANPKAKLILMYRTPWEKALTHYMHDLRYGTIPRFLSPALVLFPAFFYHRYVGDVMYGRLLGEYLKRFPAEQIYVFAAPKNNLDLEGQFLDLLDFLGVPGKIPADFHEVVNQRRQPLFPVMHRKAHFGPLGWRRNLYRMLDPLNCALGPYFHSPPKEEFFRIARELVSPADVALFQELGSKHGVRGVNYISPAGLTPAAGEIEAGPDLQ